MWNRPKSPDACSTKGVDDFRVLKGLAFFSRHLHQDENEFPTIGNKQSSHFMTPETTNPQLKPATLSAQFLSIYLSNYLCIYLSIYLNKYIYSIYSKVMQGGDPKILHVQSLRQPLKNDGWKTTFLLGRLIFRDYDKILVLNSIYPIYHQ